MIALPVQDRNARDEETHTKRTTQQTCGPVTKAHPLPPLLGVATWVAQPHFSREGKANAALARLTAGVGDRGMATIENLAGVRATWLGSSGGAISRLSATFKRFNRAVGSNVRLASLRRKSKLCPAQWSPR
jgi:hypothetical protein